jgi:hypothetical protein
MKPPINGASKGPVKTVIEKTVMANPRVLLSNMSEKTAATTANGQAPKIPACKSALKSENGWGTPTSPKAAQQDSLEILGGCNRDLKDRKSKHGKNQR